MKYLILPFLCCLFLNACQSKKQETQPIGDPPIEFIEVLNDSSNTIDIIKSSLNGLKLVHNEWVSSSFFCTDSETFLFIKKMEDYGVIGVSVDEIQKKTIFFLYVFDEQGTVLSKEVLTGANYSINNADNFQLINNRLHYVVNLKYHNEMAYDFNSKKHFIVDEKLLDWAKIKDWRQVFYISPDGNSVISFSDINLVLQNIQTNKIDTLISQKYDGSWSFGTGVWTENSNKFYFDNSGGVACIWELDFVLNTIDKIVPEHKASSPIVFSNNENTQILYCEMNCIKLVEQKKMENQ